MHVEVAEQGRAEHAVTWAGWAWVMVEVMIEAGRNVGRGRDIQRWGWGQVKLVMHGRRKKQCWTGQVNVYIEADRDSLGEGLRRGLRKVETVFGAGRSVDGCR